MSRSLVYAAVVASGLLAAGPAPAFEVPDRDRAGNRIEAFEAMAGESATEPAVHCTQDHRWCAQIDADAQGSRRWLVVFDQTLPAKERTIWRYELPESEGDEPPTLWPGIVRMQDSDGPARRSAMIGVVMHRQAGYSGGGASADALRLIKVDAGPAAAFAEVLSVPLSGSSMIRACFSDEDVEQRAGACHDEYSFSASLTLHDAEASAGLPEFSYETQATSFPGPVSRSEDSLANPPLKEKDLVTVVNETCSYARILRFNRASGRYEADLPLPDCGDFTEP